MLDKTEYFVRSLIIRKRLKTEQNKDYGLSSLCYCFCFSTFPEYKTSKDVYQKYDHNFEQKTSFFDP